MADPFNIFAPTSGANDQQPETGAAFQGGESRAALLAAENVDVLNDHRVRGRRGRKLVRAREEVTKLFSWRDRLYYVAGGELFEFQDSGEDKALGGLFLQPSELEVAEYNDTLFLVDGRVMYQLFEDQLVWWGAVGPGMFSVETQTGGILPEGRYVIAVTGSYQGVESGVLFSSHVDVGENGQITVNMGQAGERLDYFNVYLTAPYGIELYPLGPFQGPSLTVTQLSQVEVASDVLRRQPPPTSSVVRRWRGHLALLGTDRVVYFSEPGNPYAFRTSEAFLMLSGLISIEPCESGIYLWSENGNAYWCDGPTLTDLSIRHITTVRLKGASTTRVAANRLPFLEGNYGAELLPVWYTERGFAVGLPTGEIVFPQEQVHHGDKGWLTSIGVQPNEGFDQLMAVQAPRETPGAMLGGEMLVNFIPKG